MITVFTPTFNRAYRLNALYESLKRQTSKEFEWIVVDDGSQDNTAEIVSKWQAEENAFLIRYFRKENGGKHTAINLGVEQAHYDWFFIVDSDDYLIDDAVQKIHEWIEVVDNPMLAAVSGTKVYPDGQIIGQCYIPNGTYTEAKNTERKKRRLEGDKAEVYRTALLRKYPFPLFSGERFLSEDAVWTAIARDGYTIRWYYKPLIVCEYLEDGLTANATKLIFQNFEGYSYCMQLELQVKSGLTWMQCLCRYINKAKAKGLDISEISKRTGVSKPMIRACDILVNIKNSVLKGK